MVRGILPFYCSECGKHFMGPDIELGASVLSAPLECPRCGSWHTRPGSPLPAKIANQKYKKIWELTDNQKKYEHSN